MLIRRSDAYHQINSAAAFSGGPCELVATVTGYGEVELWSTVSNSLVRSTKLPFELSADESVRALSGNARLVVITDNTKTLRVRDIETGSLVHSHSCTWRERAKNLAFSHSGRHLARNGMNNSVQIWSLDAELNEPTPTSSDIYEDSTLSLASAADVVLLTTQTTYEVWMNSGRIRCPRWLHGGGDLT